MNEALVIDGYNLLYALKKQARLSPVDLEHARVQMLDQLINFAAYQDKRIIVVFDGRGTGSLERHQSVEVVYTRDNQTADSYIEMLIPELIRDHRVTVVTSDYEEQKNVFGSGALRYSSREFALFLEESKKNERRHYTDRTGQAGHLDRRLDASLWRILEKRRRE